MTQEDTHTTVYTAALFTIARTLFTTARCHQQTNQLKNQWYIHMMEYYSVIKRDAFESVLRRWMNLEPIIQSEVRKRKTKLNINEYIWNLET